MPDNIDTNYKLIPMDEISPEARKIAVLWMECEDKSWIGNKHKLASDIMNYAWRYNEKLRKVYDQGMITNSDLIEENIALKKQLAQVKAAAVMNEDSLWSKMRKMAEERMLVTDINKIAEDIRQRVIYYKDDISAFKEWFTEYCELLKNKK